MKKTILFAVAFGSVASFASVSDGIFYSDDFSSGSLADNWTTQTGLALDETNENLTLTDGTAVCEPGTIDGLTCRIVEFDMTATAAALEDPSTLPSDVQIAIESGVATDGNVPIWIGDANGWTTATTVTEGSTVAVSCVFTYGDTATCDVTLADSTGTTLYTGTFTNVASSNEVTSVAFEGSSTLDNFNLADLEKEFTGDLTGLTVAYTNLVAMGIDPTNVTTEQSYSLVAGLHPDKDVASQFAMSGMQVGAANAVTVTIPCDYDNGQLYQVDIVYDDDTATSVSSSGVTASAVANGTRTLTFTLPGEVTTSAKAARFTIKAFSTGDTSNSLGTITTGGGTSIGSASGSTEAEGR